MARTCRLIYIHVGCFLFYCATAASHAPLGPPLHAAASAQSKPVSHIAGQSIVLPNSRSGSPLGPVPLTTSSEEFWHGGSCLFGFGAGDFGQLATGRCQSSKLPVMVQGGVALVDEAGVAVMGPPIFSISGGGFHTLLLDLEGTSYSCGDNSNGQLGVGAFKEGIPGKSNRTRLRREALPVAVTHDDAGNLLPKMRLISAGTYHSLFLSTDGRLWACGHGVSGCLGQGDADDRWRPTLVQAFWREEKKRRRPRRIGESGRPVCVWDSPEDLAQTRTPYWRSNDADIAIPIPRAPEWLVPPVQSDLDEIAEPDEGLAIFAKASKGPRTGADPLPPKKGGDRYDRKILKTLDRLVERQRRKKEVEDEVMHSIIARAVLNTVKEQVPSSLHDVMGRIDHL